MTKVELLILRGPKGGRPVIEERREGAHAGRAFFLMIVTGLSVCSNTLFEDSGGAGLSMEANREEKSVSVESALFK